MSARILFVRVAGTPFNTNDLRPDCDLLQAMDIGAEQGHEVALQDLGSHETFEVLYPDHVRAHAFNWASNLTSDHLLSGGMLGGSGLGHRMPRSLRCAQHGAFQMLGERLVARTSPDSVIFKVNARKDIAATCLAAERVKAYRPRTKVFAFGSQFASDDAALTRSLKFFDAIGLTNHAAPVIDAAASTDKRHWRVMRGLAYYDGVRLILTQPEFPAEPACGVFALENSLYIYPTQYSRIRVLDLLAVGVGSGSRGMEPRDRVHDGAERRVVAPVRSIAERARTGAFFVRTPGHVPGAAVEFARNLLATETRIRYACELNLPDLQKSQLGLLAASGCVAVDLPVYSGSQRLLDTYYEADFEVTQVERLVRAARFAGMFTCAHFTYPCPEDDYHTEDETVRLIKRARPASAVVTAEPHPNRAPGFTHAHEFAPFARRTRAHAEKRAASVREAMREAGVPTGIDARTALLADLAGFRGNEVEFATTVGLQLLSGDATGLAETIEQINDGACRPARTASFKTFIVDQNAAAN